MNGKRLLSDLLPRLEVECIRVRAPAGGRIDRAIREAAALALLTDVSVVFEFNGMDVTADPAKIVDLVGADYTRRWGER